MFTPVVANGSFTSVSIKIVKPMATNFLIIGFWFFGLGHMVLFALYAEDAKGKPMKLINVIFPRPKRGRFVGYVAWTLAFLLWAFMVYGITSNLKKFDFDLENPDTWGFILWGFVLPGAPYIFFILKYLRRIDGHLFVVLPEKF
jgi:hypothetical protein